MTEKKRFVIETSNQLELSIKDNITKKYLFSVMCENIDDYENIFDEVKNVRTELNRLWEQILRFDKYNDEKLRMLCKIDNIVAKTNLENHNECWNALIKIDVITNGYGDVE